MQEAKVIRVIVTKCLIGKGEHGDPFRDITQYWEFDGTLLAEVDPWKESQIQEEKKA